MAFLQFHSKRLSVPVDTGEDQAGDSGSPTSNTPQAWVVRANHTGRILGVDVIDMSPKERESSTLLENPEGGSDSLRPSPRGNQQVCMFCCVACNPHALALYMLSMITCKIAKVYCVYHKRAML